MRSFLFSLIFLCSITSWSAEELTASQIMDKVEKSLRSKDEVAHIDMVIIEKSGQKLNRKMVVKKKSSGNKKYIMARMEAPGDVRGVGLLIVVEGVDYNQWLYLPSAKKSRRIISSKKKDSFLGSEISYEDISPTTYKHFSNKLVKTTEVKGKQAYVIESKSLGREAAYSKIITWVTKKDFRVLQSKYFDQKGKKLKIMKFKDYKKFGKRTWRAQNIDVKNYQNKRGTSLALSKLEMNTGLKVSEFSKAALERF